MIQTLYTSHDCPFCARAVSTLKYANIQTELRSSDHNHMPAQADAIIANSSIPLLVHENNQTIDESWDIVKWALLQNDPNNWLGMDNIYLKDAEMLVETFDHSFLADLKAFKENPSLRDECEEYLEELEEMFNEHEFLLADHVTVADIAIVAFIRLFALHDLEWFESTPYIKCQQWLQNMISTPYFKASLIEHRLWQQGDTPIYL